MKRNRCESQATWNQYANGNNWSAAGADGAGDFAPTVLGQLSTTRTGGHKITLNADGVAALQGWINDPATNHGLIIKDYTKATDGLDFRSRETSKASQRPKLIVSFNAGGTPDNTSSSGAGSNESIS